MANSWLRLWHDMPNDPKWRTIAKVSGQPIALVQAVFLQLLVSASQNPVTDETGVTLHIVTVTNEDISSALDVTEGDVASVTSAMQGRVLNGNTISGWNKRQANYSAARNNGKPAKSGAQRVREHRERRKQKELEERNVTVGNVTETLGNDVTPQIREEEIREEVKEETKTLLSGAEKKQHQTIEESEEPIFISLPLNDGSEFGVTESMVSEFKKLYPSADVEQELRNQRGWLMSEPTRRKTKRGIKRFITGWLSREQDKGPKIKPTAGVKQHAEFRPNQNDQRSYYEQFTEWEQQQPGAASLGAMGADVQGVRSTLECEEWQSTLGTLGGSGQFDDE
ncbi:hypothetical protein [Serratia fonticola]